MIAVLTAAIFHTTLTAVMVSARSITATLPAFTPFDFDTSEYAFLASTTATAIMCRSPDS